VDLKQLNALLAVADHGSFSAAARALHTVQSNVSTHVARLEGEVGATLIDRASGSLTPDGEVVAARARRIQAELEAMVSDLASLDSEIAGGVRVGVIGTTARWLVPRLVEAMAERHPKVAVVVVDATTTSLLLQLTTGRLDLAVINLPIDDPDVDTARLFDEDRLLVVPEGHPLFERERLTLTDLAGEPLLLEPKGTAFRDHLDRQCTDAGIELTPQAEVDGMRLLASLAFQGFGAALLPASAAPSWVGGEWKRVPVDGLAGRSVGLATLRRGMLSAPARALRDVLHRVIETEAPNQPGIHPAPALDHAAIADELTPLG
jgi:LysR family hydrogen peroxide-inducible transcriptional activator